MVTKVAIATRSDTSQPHGFRRTARAQADEMPANVHRHLTLGRQAWRPQRLADAVSTTTAACLGGGTSIARFLLNPAFPFVLSPSKHEPQGRIR